MSMAKLCTDIRQSKRLQELGLNMKHHCIFEISYPNGSREAKSRYVDDYGDDFSAADEMCQSLNNFSNPNEVRFIIRCLDQEEFDHIKDYDPFLKTVIIKNFHE